MLRLPRTYLGERIYAVGDIHGDLELFAELMTLVQLDTEARRHRRTRMIVLGNFIDRGPRSAELAGWLRKITQKTGRLIVLRGEREQLMIQALSGSLVALEDWLAVGGAATLASWGVPQDVINGALEPLQAAAAALVPTDMIDWLRRLPLFYRSGDYFFVHAGIRPGVPLNQQAARDLLQIEDDFLDFEAEHPAMIVHGHSLCEDGPELLPNRIGLNMGAYKTRRLAAVGLQGQQQWTLMT
jgi:serine/threonine protein phosphatase 1